jgi:hypothetical protein
MFIYYFMYRLQNNTVNSFRRPLSYRANRLCSGDAAKSATRMLATCDDACDRYDWGIYDEMRVDSSAHDSTLLVTADSPSLLPHTSTLKGHRGTITRYLCMSAWSYAEMCAVGLSPRLAKDASLDVTLPQVSYAASGCSSSSVNIPTSFLLSNRRFYVLHPMYILAHFIAFRSTPKELHDNEPVSYVTAGLDGRASSTPALNPEFLFLKRFEVVSSGMLVPYTPYESVYDRSLGDIKTSLFVSRDMPQGINSCCGLAERPPFAHVEGATEDATQLTLLGPLQIKQQSPTEHSNLRQVAFLGIALDLARSMRASTDNKQYRSVLAAILPFVCATTSSRLGELCSMVFAASTDPSVFRGVVRRRTAAALTFCLHDSFVHTEPNASRDYDSRMFQSLSFLGMSTGSELSTLYLYYFRSSAIKHMVSEQQFSTRSQPHNLLASTILSLDMSYSQEYFCLKRIVNPEHPVEIQVRRLPDYHRRESRGTPHANALPSNRISYFYDDNDVEFDTTGNTLFVPLNSCPYFSAIGVCFLRVDSSSPPKKHLVFYRTTTTTIEYGEVDPQTTQEIVNRWKRRVHEDLPAILVFVSDYHMFVDVQKSYAECLEQQFI